MQVYAYDTKSEVVKNISHRTLVLELETEKWTKDTESFCGMLNVLVHSLENNNRNAMCCCLFDEEDKSLIGLCYCYFPQHFPNTCIFNQIIVRHDQRNKLWGSLLVAKTKLHAVTDKGVNLFLLTPLKSAINFWEKMCFTPLNVKDMGELFPKVKIPSVYHISPECLNAMYAFRT